jgi:hypothetical protein
MKYVFLIGSEHQLFQVRLAIEHYKINNDDILLVILKYGPSAFIVELLKQNEFRNIYIFDAWSFKDLFFKRALSNKFILFCENLHLSLGRCTFLFSHFGSDPDLLFVSIVKPFRIILMDEGTASLYVRYIKRKHIKNHFQLFIKSILYLNFLELPKNFIYFTQFNLKIDDDEKIEKYEIKKEENTLLQCLENEAFFLGTNTSFGTKGDLMIFKDYLVLLREVLKHLGDKKVYYFPHRFELDSNLQMIEELGFVIQKNLIPFEKYFSQLKTWPEVICSFHLTFVIPNIDKLYVNTPKLMIYVFDHSLLGKYRFVYEDIYEEMLLNTKIDFVKIEIKTN